MHMHMHMHIRTHDARPAAMFVAWLMRVMLMFVSCSVTDPITPYLEPNSYGLDFGYVVWHAHAYVHTRMCCSGVEHVMSRHVMFQ